MNLHQSKGLEFDIVFHLDLYEWIFPGREFRRNYYGPPIYPDWEQDLNLHYVGITRAKKACILLTSGTRVNQDGETKQGQPSKFLELPNLAGLYENF